MQLDKVLDQAIKRVKERWLSALFVLGLSFGLWFLFIFVGILLGGLVIFIISLLAKPFLFVGIMLAVLAFLLGIILISSWTALAYAKVIISESSIGPFEAFSGVKSLIIPYSIFSFLSFFFMLGLLPFLAIPFVLWSIWGVLGLFVFLAEPESRGGLKPLWRSRELVRLDLGKVLLIILLFFGINAIGMRFSFLHSSFSRVLWYLVSILLITPFSSAVYWEVYKELAKRKEESEAKTPTFSLLLSAVGLAVWLFVAFLTVRALGRQAKRINWERVLERIEKRENFKKYRFDKQDFYKKGRGGFYRRGEVREL